MKRNHWNCHDHRDELRVSDENTVYHEEQGQLCYGVRHGMTMLFYPVRFRDKPAAYRWVESGCIAEIQEGMSLLSVGFVKENIDVARPAWWSAVDSVPCFDDLYR